MNTLQATLTRTWNNQPLVVLNGGPFNRTEATPAQLRALAAALVRAASLAELRPTEGRHWAPKTVVLSLAPVPQTHDAAATALDTWQVRRVLADMSITYAGQRWCVMHLPDVHPGDLVRVRRAAPGGAPEIQAVNAPPPGTSASRPAPAHSCPRSGCPAAGTPANSDSQTTPGAQQPPGPCPASNGTPQRPCCANQPAHSHSRSEDTADAAPGADPIATLVALAQRLAQRHGIQGTGTAPGVRVGVSLHFSDEGVDEPPLCSSKTACAACKNGFCLECVQQGAFQ